MRSTRKKVIKTVYKDEDSEEEGDDFSDAGSEAKFSEESSSDEEIECVPSSGDEFDQKTKKARPPRQTKNIKSMGVKKPFVKNLVSKINKQMSAGSESENVDVSPALFSVKDLTESDKLLPSILNLSESDSSDDDNELPNAPNTSNISSRSIPTQNEDSDSDNDTKTEYKDVWSHNIQENSEEIAKKTFMELEQHKSQIEETKASLQNYTMKIKGEQESSDVKDLLALGEEALPEETAAVIKKIKARKRKNESDSEMEDWEEVKESKAIPQQGLQLFVEFPEAGCRKSKKLDVEMMMKRKINRVKKEYQVYMHKVHVLCWLGHGNYINRVLNDQEIMSIVLSLVPSKECYPGERVDMKYVEQITTWFKDKLTLKQDKNEDKFKPKAPPLKTILLEQIKKKVVTSKKYLVFIFVAMLRALGLQCRVMFNFVTVPIKPPSSELCSLSTKAKAEKESHHDTKKADSDTKEANKVGKSKAKSKCKKETMPQLDGHFDFSSDDQKIMQLDGSDDKISGENRTTRSKRKKPDDTSAKKLDEDISPPKLAKKGSGRKTPSLKQDNITNEEESKNTQKRRNTKATENKKEIVQKNVSISNTSAKGNISEKSDDEVSPPKILKKGLGRASPIQRSTRGKATVKPKKESSNANSAAINSDNKPNTSQGITLKVIKSQTININPATVTTLSAESSTIDSKKLTSDNNSTVPNISITDENQKDISSKYFNDSKASKGRLARTRSKTNNPTSEINKEDKKDNNRKTRNKSAPAKDEEKSKYFNNNKTKENTPKKGKASEDSLRVSHRDLAKNRPKANNDVTGDLIGIVKKRIKEAKDETKKGLVKGKIKKESDEDSDYLPEVDAKRRSGSEDDFKPCKISPRPSTSRKIDRRVLSSTDEEPVKKNKIDVWCEIFVEELEQWISVDVIKGKVHSTGDLYNNATHPVCYTVGWDNSNHLKDLTRKYVPHWNTVTRKLRAEPVWWDKAVKPWLGPKTAREREEDEYLDKMQLEAPLPKSIAEYKNHPLYALKRHLLKFEAIYPPDAAVLGFVRNEPVYARECVYTCRSRDTWLKEAKVVKLGENPYKVVKARPKWDKLSNKVITDKPLEVFGPWQVQEYEPPVAENGIVPRNAYGNVELFKECMLPKGTVHIKLPGLNRVAKKLNIDCAPAMTGFDFNGGWSHPVYDGFVVCKEFEEIITEAWMKDQEEQERRELEKMEARVYGNWKRLIKGLMIRERLKDKYGFEEPPPEQSKSKNKGPRLVVKKKS